MKTTIRCAVLCILSVSIQVQGLDEEGKKIVNSLRPWPSQTKLFQGYDWELYFKAAKYFQALTEQNRVEFITYVRDYRCKRGPNDDEREYVDEGNRRLILLFRVLFQAEDISEKKFPEIVHRLNVFRREINIKNNNKNIDNFGWPIRWDVKSGPSLIQGYSGREFYDALTEYDILKTGAVLREIKVNDG